MSKPHVRKISTTGKTDSYYVVLPKAFVRELSWRKGQKVVVEKRGKEIVIRDWKP